MSIFTVLSVVNKEKIDEKKGPKSEIKSTTVNTFSGAFHCYIFAKLVHKMFLSCYLDNMYQLQ